jgi:hypothetical protein
LTNVTTANGPITVTAGGFVTATNVVSLTDADANDISITGNGIQVGYINAGTIAGDVILNAGTGAITEDGDGAADVIAQELYATAQGGIDLDTQITYLQATNSVAGDIVIDNTGALYIFGTGVRNSAPAGQVIITTASPLYIIYAPIIADGNIILTANGVDGDIITGNWLAPAIQSYNGNVTLNAARDILLGQGGFGDIYTHSGSGYISLNAARDIIVDTNTYVISNTGYIEFIAGRDIQVLNTAWVYNAATGDINFTAGNDIIIDAVSLVQGMWGDITLRANNDVDVGNVQTTGNVTIIADNDGSGLGAITDNNGALDNIACNILTLSAATGIGFGTVLETVANTLIADNSTSGDIEISNTGDLYAQHVVNQNGNVKITVASDLTVGDIQALGGFGVYLTATTGSILDDVALDPLDTNGIIASLVVLDAFGDIGSAIAKGDIDVAADTIRATANGNIIIEEKDGAYFENIVSNNGFIALLAHASSIFGLIQAEKLIDIEVTNGDMTISGSLTSFTATISIIIENGSLLAIGVGPHIVCPADAYIFIKGGTLSATGDPINVLIDGDLLLDMAEAGNVGGICGYFNGSVHGQTSGMYVLFMNSSFPSPLLPNGIVFFNGNIIWPPINMAAYNQMLELLSRKFENLHAGNLQNFRLVSIDTNRPLFYFYHPLTPTDSSAFDNITLDAGAYEFIENLLQLRGSAPGYFGIEEDKKKKKPASA